MNWSFIVVVSMSFRLANLNFCLQHLNPKLDCQMRINSRSNQVTWPKLKTFYAEITSQCINVCLYLVINNSNEFQSYETMAKQSQRKDKRQHENCISCLLKVIWYHSTILRCHIYNFLIFQTQLSFSFVLLDCFLFRKAKEWKTKEVTQ